MQNVQPTPETGNDDTSERAETLTVDRVVNALVYDDTSVELELATEIEATVEVIKLAVEGGGIGLAQEPLAIALAGVERRARLLKDLLDEQREKRGDAVRAKLGLAEGGA